MSSKTLDLSELAKSFKSGIYRHYKGGLYNAMFVAKHSEHHEQELVVYQSLEHGHIWVRPLSMFLDNVMIDDIEKPRFEWVSVKL